MKAQLFDSIRDKAGMVSRSAFNLLMPARCPVSGDAVAAPGYLGPAGWGEVHFIEEPYCGCCGIPFAADYGDDVLCPSCIAEPPVYDRARAAIVYNDAAPRLVSGLKFNDHTEYAEMLGRWMVRAGQDILRADTLLIPVPLHWRRLLLRRFNQSALLAQAIAGASETKVRLRGLRRTRPTPPQKEITSAEGRRRNVAGAFAVREEDRRFVEGGRIILVDDVLTSGATVSACARALKAAGASQVDVLVLARVVKGGGGAI